MQPPLRYVASDGDAVTPAKTYPVTERPMYGGVAKTPAMIAADDALIEAAEKLGTRPHVSDMLVARGWQAFFRGDLGGAMKQFNQAWLLDPENGDAFHGFALIVFERDRDGEQAGRLFQQGLGKARQSPGLYLDYGRFLLTVHRPADAVLPLRKALTFPDMGPDAMALLSLALAQTDDTPGACAAAAKVQDNAQGSIRDEARALLKTPRCRAAP
jgi:Tfp pilus assembly protein PilF